MPKWSSTQGEIVSRCYAIEARVAEGADTTLLLATSNVMKGMHNNSSRNSAFSEAAHRRVEEAHW